MTSCSPFGQTLTKYWVVEAPLVEQGVAVRVLGDLVEVAQRQRAAFDRLGGVAARVSGGRCVL
jgi:hypothetical protein